MSIEDYLETYNEIHNRLIRFIDMQDNIEEHFQNLATLLQDKKIREDKNELKLLLHFITSISDNHYRSENFFSKIERILEIFHEEIKKYYSNKTIFNIFKSNKRLLLFLFQSKILDFDQYIFDTITTDEYVRNDYPQYFSPEIKSSDFTKENLNVFSELPENFIEDRKSGENSIEICKLIQKDQIEQFITYVNKTNYSLKSQIDPSIYETNAFLNENKRPTLIEYSAFFGSIQIFKYLQLNGVELTPSLWNYAVHGRHPEIVNFLEENKIKPEIDVKVENKKRYQKVEYQKVVSYEKCFYESIRCNHNEIKNYIQDNYLSDINTSDTMKQSLKYYNFIFIEKSSINENFLHELCQYDYYCIIKCILENTQIDINAIKDKKTALYIAVEEENCEICELLMTNAEINVNLMYIKEISFSDYRSNEYQIEKSPLYLAVEKENIEIIKLFLKNETLDINCLNHVFSYDKKESETKDEEEEDDYDCSPQEISEDLYQPLNNSEEYKDPTTTIIKDDLKTSFYLAVEKGNCEIIQLLLENEKIDINIVNNIKTEKEEYYEKYRRYQRGNTIGMNVKTTTKEDKTAFYLAAEMGNLELIKLLISNEKIDINIINKIKTKIYDEKDIYNEATDSEIQETIETEHKTALYLAVEKEKIELLNLLLSSEKIDVNLACKSDEYYRLAYYNENRMEKKYEVEKTPFYLAVEYRNITIIKLLLQNENININKNYTKSEVDDKYGENGEKCSTKTYKIMKSPLHLAVHNNNIDIIKILLDQKNIDLSAKDNDGKTPIELTNNERILNLFSK